MLILLLILQDTSVQFHRLTATRYRNHVLCHIGAYEALWLTSIIIYSKKGIISHYMKLNVGRIQLQHVISIAISLI